jgi:hypothetical protein
MKALVRTLLFCPPHNPRSPPSQHAANHSRISTTLPGHSSPSEPGRTLTCHAEGDEGRQARNGVNKEGVRKAARGMLAVEIWGNAAWLNVCSVGDVAALQSDGIHLAGHVLSVCVTSRPVSSIQRQSRFLPNPCPACAGREKKRRFRFLLCFVRLVYLRFSKAAQFLPHCHLSLSYTHTLSLSHSLIHSLSLSPSPSHTHTHTPLPNPSTPKAPVCTAPSRPMRGR